MKIPKLLLADLLALSSATLVNAQTVVHICGSTAFRNAAVTAITHILQPGFTYAYQGTTFTKANQAIFTGTTITNSIPVIIKTSWSGSVSGVQTVSQQFPISTFLTNTTAQSTGGTPSAPAVYDPPTVPEVGMCDGDQSDTQYPTPVLSGHKVGVVAFKWVRGTGSPSTWTNATPNLVQNLYLNGNLPLALFTGNPADQGTQVFAAGRDADSGTRKNAFAESGLGVFTAPLQYVPTNSAGAIISGSVNGPVAGQEPYPAETIFGVFFDVGQGGYSSGGDLAHAVGASGSFAAIGGYYLTYLGVSDAATAEGLGAAEISWNGVPYSDQAIQQGNYSFWGYENLFYRANYGTVDANGKEVADLLAQQMINTDSALAGELLSSMSVTRSGDGGLISNNY